MSQVKILISSFLEKILILGFPLCSTCEVLSIDVSVTNVGLIFKKLWRFLFSRYRQTDETDKQTDTVLESSHGNMSARKKFQLKAQNKWLAVDPYMPPRRTGMHNNIALNCYLFLVLEYDSKLSNKFLLLTICFESSRIQKVHH